MTNLPDDTRLIGRLRNAGPGPGTDACSTLGALRVDEPGALWRYTGNSAEPYGLLVAAYPAAPGDAPVAYTAGPGPTVAGTGLVPYVDATRVFANVPAATYEASWGITFTANSTGIPGTSVDVNGTLVPDGVVIGWEAMGPGRKQSNTAIGTFVHPGGPLAIAVSVRRSAGSGNVIAQEFTIVIRRTGP